MNDPRGHAPVPPGRDAREPVAELKQVNREIKRLRAELAEFDERRAKLSSDLPN